MYVCMYVCMDRWIWAELHKLCMYVQTHTHTHTHIYIYIYNIYIYIYIYIHQHTYIHTECNFSQYVFQSMNTQVIIDMQEQIWMPNKNICDCHLTLNRH